MDCGHFELRLYLYSAVQNRPIFQTIRVRRNNGQYILVLECTTRRVDQSLRNLEASLLPFFPFLRNITLNDMNEQLPWRNWRSIMRRFWGRSSSVIFVLSMLFLSLEDSCFVWTVRCGNVVLSSVHGWLTTSKAFTCAWSSSPITQSRKHKNGCLEKGIHCDGNWQTIQYTSTRWYLQLGEIRRRDGKRHNIWRMQQLEGQMVSSWIWNTSP